VLVPSLTAAARFDWYCNLTAWENHGLFKIWTYESKERDCRLLQASTIFTDPENRATSVSKINSCHLRRQDVCSPHRDMFSEISLEHKIYGRKGTACCSEEYVWHIVPRDSLEIAKEGVLASLNVLSTYLLGITCDAHTEHGRNSSRLYPRYEFIVSLLQNHTFHIFMLSV
jgi:hypothetical protein